jgi:hypothetical protein
MTDVSGIHTDTSGMNQINIQLSEFKHEQSFHSLRAGSLPHEGSDLNNLFGSIQYVLPIYHTSPISIIYKVVG